MPTKKKSLLSAAAKASLEPPASSLSSPQPVPTARKRAAPKKQHAPKSTDAPAHGTPKARAPKRKRPLLDAPGGSSRDLDDKLLELIGKTGLPDPDGEFENLKYAHAHGPLNVKTLLYRQDFARALTVWLKNMKYQIGLDPKDFNAAQELKWAKHLVDIGAQLLSVGGPMFISGGATSEQTFPVLVPFLSLADFVCFQVKYGTPILLLVIFADGLAAETLLQRFDEFLRLAKPMPQFGLKLNGGAISVPMICPLLIYFDEPSYESAVKALLPGARVTKVWDHLNLLAGFVNVPGKQVMWPEHHGVLASIGSWVTRVTGAKRYLFDTVDLQSVLSLAGPV